MWDIYELNVIIGCSAAAGFVVGCLVVYAIHWAFFDDKRKRSDDGKDGDNDSNRYKTNDNGTIDVIVDADQAGDYPDEQKDARLRSSFGKAEKHNDAYHMDEDITAL